MPNKHEMRKGYYRKMQEWKEKQKTDTKDSLATQKKRPICKYQNIGEPDQSSQIDTTR